MGWQGLGVIGTWRAAVGILLVDEEEGKTLSQ